MLTDKLKNSHSDTSETCSCAHCDTYIDGIRYFDKLDNVFCCLGCKTVYSLINSNGLGQYYDLKKTDAKDDARPAYISNKEFLYLDTEDFLSKYSLKEEDQLAMNFYVEGVHCMACLWLMEKIPELFENVKFVDFNWTKSTLKVVGNENIKFSEIAKRLDSFGYQLHAIENESDADKLAKKEERKDLLRIGVAAACAGNIMIYAVSLYAGVKGELAEFFGLLSLLLCLPAVLYSAIPFYKSAYYSLQSKKISIDIPITFAIGIAMIHGSYNILLGDTQHHFFDSITILIFLLLLTRQFLKRVQKHGLKTKSLSAFFNDGEVLVKKDGDYFPMHLNQIVAGDIIKVESGRNIPTDGVVLNGESKVNLSLLTGESRPSDIKESDDVYAGTVNLESDLIIKVTKVSSETRLGKILETVVAQNKKQTLISTYSEKVSSIFTVAIISLALIVFIALSITINVETALWRSLALIIITCPCALALATPLAMSLALANARSNGVLIKDDSVVEKVSKSKNIFFDKTGTLTYGNPKVVEWNYSKNVQDKTYVDSLVLSLEEDSSHPLAKSIVEFLSTKAEVSQLDLIDKNEVFGVGVEGSYENKKYVLKALKDHNFDKTALGLYMINDSSDQLLLTILLEDKLRSGAKRLVDKLQNNFNVHLLSGDNESYVRSVGNDLGIDKQNQFFAVSPEFKQQIVSDTPLSIMVGDGANDAMALRNSLVGVAMHGSMDVSLRSADVYISSNRQGLFAISYLTDLCHVTMSTIRRNLILSLLYNVVGIGLAITGFATPLVAAILMPISSLTVLISTILGIKNLKGEY